MKNNLKFCSVFYMNISGKSWGFRNTQNKYPKLDNIILQIAHPNSLKSRYFGLTIWRLLTHKSGNICDVLMF